jgi:predicted nucleic acid-binding Zn ribbon protein
MATYVYETIPQAPGEATTQFEIKQSMKDAPLTRHPETGAPVRRVITGGFGLIGANTGKSSEGKKPKEPSHQPEHKHSGGCCGGACGCSN